jgi:hypothetical protein
MKGNPDDRLIASHVAALAGTTRGSVRTYRLRRALLEPDGYLARTPWWRRDTVETWLRTPPCRGRRTFAPR